MNEHHKPKPEDTPEERELKILERLCGSLESFADSMDEFTTNMQHYCGELNDNMEKLGSIIQKTYDKPNQ